MGFWNVVNGMLEDGGRFINWAAEEVGSRIWHGYESTRDAVIGGSEYVNLFNAGTRKRAVDELDQAFREYQKVRGELQFKSVELFELRQHVANETIFNIQQYINELASAPKDFRVAVEDISQIARDFNHVVNDVGEMVEKAHLKTSIGVATAAAGGAAVAATAPTVAMAVATTFGTASTGTAISALSGAAASNAALAWLGGGTLAAGGSGIAGGSQLLGILGGPIGWAVSAGTLVVTGWLANNRNLGIAQTAARHTIEVRREITRMRAVSEHVGRIIGQTKEHRTGVDIHLTWLYDNAPLDYHLFTERDKQELIGLINNVASLRQLLAQRIDPTEGA